MHPDLPQPSAFFRVIAREDAFVVIDKAAGISVHRDSREQGLLPMVAAELGLERLYLVHRLDSLTSGLLLLATSAGSCAVLAAQFAERSVEKFYIALTDRRPARKQGTVQGDMVRSRNGSWRLSRDTVNPAITRFTSCGVGEGLRLVLLKPETGRTHQLRVALKSLGAPIVGDRRYGGSAADRGYLHAMALRFDWAGERRGYVVMPGSGQHFDDAGVRQALAAWSAPWQLPWPGRARSVQGSGEGGESGEDREEA